MTKAEAAERLSELADEIYYVLREMKDILREAAPEELERAGMYWMAHIYGALLNRQGRMGGSFISLEDTITALEKAEFEDDEEFTDLLERKGR
jgi:hypothetical protein